MIRSSRVSVAAIAPLLLILAAAAPLEESGYVLTVGGSEVFVGNGRMKISVPGMMQMGFIPEGDSLWMANPRNRTYWQGTLDEYCAESKQAQTAMMADMMSKLTPAQRAMMAEHMKGDAPADSAKPADEAVAAPAPKVTIERTDETATIAGHATRKIRIRADGDDFQDVWLTTDSTMARVINFAKGHALQERMRECVTGEMEAQQDRDMQKMGAMGRWAIDRKGVREKVKRSRAIQATPEYQQVMREGFPLKIVPRLIPNAQPIVIEKVERRQFKPADLAPPTDFRRAPLAQVQVGSN